MSIRLKLLSALLRGFVKPMVARALDPAALRRRFEYYARRTFRRPPYTLVRRITLAPNQVALAVTARPGTRAPRPGKALLYFHGGGFLVGSPRTHAAMLARLSRLARIEVIAPYYRLAPENPFPAAVIDARAAWDGLRARGYAPADIVLGGDSAGGNLALGLLADVLADGQRPAGLVGFSPVTDLTFSGASFKANAKRDVMLPASRSDDLLRFYLNGAPADDPRASPLFAEFDNPPPVFLQFAETEILFDDCRRMAEELRAAGGDVVCDVWPDAPHVWVIFDGYVPEAREGLRRAAHFIAGLWPGDQASAITPASR